MSAESKLNCETLPKSATVAICRQCRRLGSEHCKKDFDVIVLCTANLHTTTLSFKPVASVIPVKMRYGAEGLELLLYFFEQTLQYVLEYSVS